MLTSARGRRGRPAGRPSIGRPRSVASASAVTGLVDRAPCWTAVYRRRGEVGRSARAAAYPAGTVRLVEIRLLEGPNVYRLEPVVKLEVAVGRRRTWYGQRDPGRHALVRLGATVPGRATGRTRSRRSPAWIRRLRVGPTARAAGGPAVHRSSDPGHWIVTFPWAVRNGRAARPRPPSPSPSATCPRRGPRS